jgi:hypothetical protein
VVLGRTALREEPLAGIVQCGLKPQRIELQADRPRDEGQSSQLADFVGFILAWLVSLDSNPEPSD